MGRSQVPSSSGRPLLYVLIFLQIACGFALGVYGNKVAEAINVPPELLVVAIAVTMLLLLAVSALLVNYQMGRGLGFPGRAIALGRPLVSFVTVFPFAVALGLLMQFGALLLPNSGAILESVPGWGFHEYEAMTALVAIGTLIFFRGARGNVVLMLGYCLGLSIGISGTLLMLRPGENNPTGTLIGWTVLLVALGLVTSSRRVAQYVAKTFKTLTQGA